MGSLRLVAIVLLLGSPAFAQSSPTYGVGRTPTAEEIRALDISIGPTGEELPQGRGTAKEGAARAILKAIRAKSQKPAGERLSPTDI